MPPSLGAVLAADAAARRPGQHPQPTRHTGPPGQPPAHPAGLTPARRTRRARSSAPGGLSAGMPLLDSDFDPLGEVMTAPDARPPRIMDRPACTPSAIRTALAANADAEVLQRYEADLDVAYEQARERGELT